MNNVFLSKSSYCKCAQCEKIYWLSKYKPDCSAAESDESAFEEGRQVGELAKGLFGDYEDVPYNKDISLRVEKTRKLLKDKPNLITEASFIYDNNFCSVDILKNDSDGVEIYEVKSSSKLKDIDLNDPAYQYFVLTNLGLNVKRVCVVHINNEYIRGKELEIDKLFKIEDVTGIAQDKQDEIKYNIDFINEYMEEHNGDNEPEKEIGEQCFNPRSCDFWDYCTKDLPKPNVFDLKGGMWTSTKFKKYYNGTISFEDLQNDKLGPKYLEQIDFELNDREPKIEKEPIKEFLSTLKYPLYFIDYESFNPAIPEYEGTRPYQQIPFQYSLHIIREEGAPLEHEEFLAEVDDCNLIRHFAKSMIGALPDDGSVIVYNRTFEESQVNKKLAEMYPDLKNEIERINGNIIDIKKPFSARNYYVKEMAGSASLKDVLPALYPNDSELSYDELELVHNGGQASRAFLSLNGKTPEEQKSIREALLKYCELDTLAMVKIWERFKEVTD